MPLAAEIVRGFSLAFGAMQSISNTGYLFRKGGTALARRQHRELPDTATDRQMRIKAACMLLFGVLFLAAGLFSYFSRTYYKGAFLAVFGAYTLYALAEALYYRFWRCYGAFALSAALFLLAIVFG